MEKRKVEHFTDLWIWQRAHGQFFHHYHLTSMTHHLIRGMVRAMVLGLLLVLILPIYGIAQNDQGKVLYERWCSQCHGKDGDGRGYAADRVNPRPTDFTSGLFKLKSTPPGQVPLDEDLFRTISRGIPGTAMPSSENVLTEEERWQVVAYIKTFSKRFAQVKGPPQAITIGPQIPSSPESISKGQQLYRELECFECHGEKGRGDGPFAPNLIDDWGYPIRPANLTKPFNYRRGSQPEEIYPRLHTGMEGTPMLSFSDVLDNEKTWHLVNYVRSIQEERRLSISLRGRPVQNLPTGPDDPVWNQADHLDIPMVGQIIAEPRMFTHKVDNVRVRILYTGRDVAILLEWDDPWPNTGEGTPPDGVGIQFPLELSEGIAKPYVGMGDRDNPVYIWAWWANSPKAVEFNARGSEKEDITRQRESDVLVQSGYKDGRYRVVFIREMNTGAREDLQFSLGAFIPFALMAYDGANGEEKGKKAVSTWYYLMLEPPTPLSAYLIPPIAGLLVIVAEFWIARVVRRERR